MSAPIDATALLEQAERAATIRAHQTDPAVVALNVERVRDNADQLMWVGIAVGMVFTTITVQQWASGGGVALDSLTWWAAWLLAPLVEIPLIVILRAEQVLNRHNVHPGAVVRRTRRGLLAAAYAMNTYAAWAALLGGKWGFDDLLMHSIPPLAVLAGAEVLTDLRDAFGRVVTATVAPRPPARPAARKPSPTARKPEPEATAPPPPLPPSPPVDPPARGAQEIAVAWVLEHWDDEHRDPRTGEPCPIRPLHVLAHMKAIGQEIHKSTATKVMNAARAERARLGLPTGPYPVDTSEENAG